VQKTVDVPEPPLTLAGVTLHKRSAELADTERETGPLKPLSEAIVIVDGTLVFVVTEILVGFALIAKSWI
jgi:hypothetical protein